MTSTTIDLQVKTYIAAVAARLADLPQEERDDLMADLEQHLHEVAAEGDGTLIERVGTPESYAAELRTSAGLPEWHGARSRRILADARAHLSEAPLIKETLAFLPELRPGWWVVRAGIVAAALTRTLYHDASSETELLFWVLAAGVLAVPSVLLGRAASHNRTARWVSILGNIPTVIVGFMLLSVLGTGAYAQPEYYEETLVEYLHHDDGSPIANICAYSTELELLDGVLLFDEEGRPIDNPSSLYDGSAVQPRGQGFANLYPRKYLTYDEMGAEEEIPFECPTLNKGAKKKGSERAVDRSDVSD